MTRAARNRRFINGRASQPSGLFREGGPVSKGIQQHPLQVAVQTLNRGLDQARPVVWRSFAKKTACRMLEHYSRIRIEAKRAALDAILAPVFDTAVHQNVHQLKAVIQCKTVSC